MLSNPQYKKYLPFVVSFLVILAVVFVVIRNYKKSNEGLNLEQKKEIINKLNEDAKNAPPVTDKEKASIIKTVNGSTSKQLTPEEKQAIINSANKK